MALYTMSFSLAHIASSKSGLEIIARSGYQINWIVMVVLVSQQQHAVFDSEIQLVKENIYFKDSIFFAVKAFVYLIQRLFLYLK
jgi:hypothetical protein